MAKFKLYTTLAEFDALHEANDGRRAKQVKVPRAALTHILMDHSRMMNKLLAAGVSIEDDYSTHPEVRKAEGAE